MTNIEQLQIVESAVNKGEFKHPFELGVDFDYLPSAIQRQPTCEDEFRFFVDKEDATVYIYVDGTFIQVYEIHSKSI